MIRLARGTKVTRVARVTTMEMAVRVAGFESEWFAKVTRLVRVARVERIGDLGWRG